MMSSTFISFQPSVNGSDSVVPLMPNVLKVFLENGQTKSFKYDSSTTVQVMCSISWVFFSRGFYDNVIICVDSAKLHRASESNYIVGKSHFALPTFPWCSSDITVKTLSLSKLYHNVFGCKMICRRSKE